MIKIITSDSSCADPPPDHPVFQSVRARQATVTHRRSRSITGAPWPTFPSRRPGRRRPATRCYYCGRRSLDRHATYALTIWLTETVED